MREPPGWAGLGQVLASLMFIWAVVRQYFPDFNHRYFRKYTDRVVGLVYPYIQIKFPENTGQRFKRSEAYSAIEAYLGTICTVSAKRFRADVGKDSTKLSLSMDDAEEVHDEFKGAKVWWTSEVTLRKSQGFSYYPANDEQRYYRLTFHRRHRDLVNDHYLAHVMEKGREASVTRRQRKLYTNNPTGGGYHSALWSHVPFEHPATFDTIAMDPNKKREIVDDLLTFRGNKDYYTKIGRAWKRGYLLYGPPGTGKSSMVAAMANLLDYDVYDVELTAVANNTALRKLLIETSSKSVIVIEDIDCSLDLTGQRKKKKKDEDNKDGGDNKPPLPSDMEERKDSKVTLSGLLNFIDGLWSSCGGERLIVFTTNHIEKLDEALIRKGRMDKHIELSYCCFEAFKVLAKNYLDIDSHPLFQQIQERIDESKITPADVAECLMPKVQPGTEEDTTKNLESLLVAMDESKEKALREAEEAAAAKAKAEEEAATKATGATTSPPAASTTDTAPTNTTGSDKTLEIASANGNLEENKTNSQAPEGEKKAEANGSAEVKS